jgi:hypothetical protein
MGRRRGFSSRSGSGIVWAAVIALFVLVAHDTFADDYRDEESAVEGEAQSVVLGSYDKPVPHRPIRRPKWPGNGSTVIERTKYTCSNGSVEVADETACGNRAHCEDLCQHSGGSGGSCSSSEYFCSVAQP